VSIHCENRIEKEGDGEEEIGRKKKEKRKN
jgi:hypothetical protein